MFDEESNNDYDRMPEEIHGKMKQIASRDGEFQNQFLANLIYEKYEYVEVKGTEEISFVKKTGERFEFGDLDEAYRIAKDVYFLDL